MAEPLTLLNQEESTLLQSIAGLSEDERNKYFDENPAVQDYYSNLVKKLETPRTPVDYEPTILQSSLQKFGKVYKVQVILQRKLMINYQTYT